jgi:hypothetical protein
MKLHAVKFGLAWGIFYAFFLLVIGLLTAYSNWGAQIAELYSSFFFGFGPSLVGALVGAVWGFVIGFVFGGVVAWLYNALL